MRKQLTTKGNETPVLLAHAMGDSTDIFGILGRGGWNPQTTPSVRHCPRVGSLTDEIRDHTQLDTHTR